MTVTRIEAVTKAKYKVYIDGQFVFVLYKGELSRYRLAEGSLIEEEVYHAPARADRGDGAPQNGAFNAHAVNSCTV